MHRSRASLVSVVLLAWGCARPAELAPAAPVSARPAECSSCAEWNVPHPATRIHGNTYYVGTNGLSALLITSPEGHVLIDGALPESAPQVMANIMMLGFRMRDVKVILNSHAHFDHAGGIAALQRASGARVLASAWSADVLRRGASGPDDPQYGVLLPFPAVANVSVLPEGDTVRVGPLAIASHRTAGHTPGGTSWSWRSCDDVGRCLDFVYADSQTPVSADAFLFTKSATYPTALADFAHGLAAIESLRCDVLLTPHPSASRMFERFGTPALVDGWACRAFAASAREGIARRVAKETTGR